MKLIHCADLHLDSSLGTHMSAEQAAKRNAEILKTFRRMTEYAKENDVRVVLIAGDFFDGTRVSGRTIDSCLDAMERSENIDFLVLSGNHDDVRTAFQGKTMPENVKIFSDHWQTYSYDNLEILGIEETEENAEGLYDSLPEKKEAFRIVMLHGQIGSSCGVDQVNLNRLKGRGIDYLALGHIHAYACERLDEKGIYCYPGCLEGRGFDECGEKGFVLLNVDEDGISSSFVPYAARRLHRIPVDVSGLESNAAAEIALREAAREVPSEDMVEFLLEGRVSAESRISAKYLERFFEDDFFFVKVKDESKLAFAEEDYSNDISLKGEFIRHVLAADLTEEKKARMIRIGLEALRGEEITV